MFVALRMSAWSEIQLKLKQGADVFLQNFRKANGFKLSHLVNVDPLNFGERIYA